MRTQGLFRLSATQVPALFFYSREKSLHSLPFPVENQLPTVGHFTQVKVGSDGSNQRVGGWCNRVTVG